MEENESAIATVSHFVYFHSFRLLASQVLPCIPFIAHTVLYTYSISVAIISILSIYGCLQLAYGLGISHASHSDQ